MGLNLEMLALEHQSEVDGVWVRGQRCDALLRRGLAQVADPATERVGEEFWLTDMALDELSGALDADIEVGDALAARHGSLGWFEAGMPLGIIEAMVHLRRPVIGVLFTDAARQRRLVFCLDAVHQLHRPEGRENWRLGDSFEVSGLDEATGHLGWLAG